MRSPLLPLTALTLAGLLAGGCAAPRGGADYRGYETRQAQTVQFGVVESIRNVRIQSRDSGVGVTSGAVLGGIAGSTIGQGRGSVAAAVAGAVVGGLAGSAIERDANQQEGIEITVKLEGGKMIAVVQGADENFRPGDRVRVLTGPGGTRVTH